MKNYVQYLARLTVGSVQLQATDDTPEEEIALGAMQLALAEGGRGIAWEMQPVGPKTIRPIGSPIEAPAEQLTGQDALGTDEEVFVPPDGLDVPDEVLAQLQEFGGEGDEEVEDEDAAFVAEVMAYLDAEESLDERRQAGDTITAEDYATVRQMRRTLMDALSPTEAEGGEALADVAVPTDSSGT